MKTQIPDPRRGLQAGKSEDTAPSTESKDAAPPAESKNTTPPASSGKSL